jgi:hypothetical protein
MEQINKPRLRQLAEAFVKQEGSESHPKSVHNQMVKQFKRYNVGHLVWAGQRGAIPVQTRPTGRKWAGWETREASIQGLERQLLIYARRGLTLADAIFVYAPPIENNSQAYLQNVSKWTGILPHEKLKHVLFLPAQAA